MRADDTGRVLIMCLGGEFVPWLKAFNEDGGQK